MVNRKNIYRINNLGIPKFSCLKFYSFHLGMNNKAQDSDVNVGIFGGKKND